MTLAESLKGVTDITPYIGTRPFSGVRYNPLKLTRERFEALFPGELSPCPFHKDGYYAEADGSHPLHLAGGFYIQEPSAMSAVTALDLQPDDRVLDVCAAPGSKTTAVAPYCDILVCNEINAARAGELVGNIERMGISNALVTNSDSAALAAAFPEYFDKVLVDSPCSGEGMFRKHPQILTEWTPELVAMCAARSREILKNAARTLRGGGRLVYSTCTYNLEENEKVILDFLAENPDFSPVDTGLSAGVPGFSGLSEARRIFIEQGGEGHFVCALQKSGGTRRDIKPVCGKAKAPLDGIIKAPLAFYKRHGFTVIEAFGAYYAVHERMPQASGVRILRAGVKLASVKGKTVRPEHHLCMAAAPGVLQSAPWSPEYLRGEETETDVCGWAAVTYEGLALGLGKGSGGRLKNHLPKGLRTV